GRISSPEYEAQLRAAQSNLEKAKQALAEAESLIDQRNAVLAAAKSDFERGEQLIGKQTITQQTFDQRRRNYEGSQASVQGAIAQRDQADAAIKSAQAEVERIEAILHDLILVSPRTERVQYQLARNGEVVAAGGKVLTILDLRTRDMMLNGHRHGPRALAYCKIGRQTARAAQLHLANAGLNPYKKT